MKEMASIPAILAAQAAVVAERVSFLSVMAFLLFYWQQRVGEVAVLQEITSTDGEKVVWLLMGRPKVGLALKRVAVADSMSMALGGKEDKRVPLQGEAQVDKDLALILVSSFGEALDLAAVGQVIISTQTPLSVAAAEVAAMGGGTVARNLAAAKGAPLLYKAPETSWPVMFPAKMEQTAVETSYVAQFSYQ